MSASTYDRIILAAQNLATAHHAPYDPSHDIHHVSRVTSLALLIADSLSSSSSSSESTSSPPLDFLVIHLSALFHDLLDSKYLPPLAPGSSYLTPRSRLEEPFWSKFTEEEISQERRRLVERIVENVSYSKEVKRMRGELGGITEWHRECRELHCVQDADKLDAIGAFGIMRCAAYSAVSNRPLFAPSSSPSTSSSSSTTLDQFPPRVEPGADAISHFHDKLVKLEGMMKTEKGRELAKKRTERLKEFIGWAEEEWDEIEQGRQRGTRR
ncbi:HD domain-containing protein [Sporobolomyces salmoneus]|uniref:HD domain-containing protein n=1 Tax=Sporobolomyces salmoneus TaxID=183962 RepID=UPI00316DCF1F